MFGRLIKAVLVLAILGLAGLAGYAYLADLSPAPSEVTQSVTIDVD